MILCIETATPVCSVALVDSSGVTGERVSDLSRSHASVLTVFIDELLRENNIAASDLQAVAVSKGPGSYTGLRIGVSAAKGLAFGASLPLVAIDTTKIMFAGIKEKDLPAGFDRKTGYFCPMIDARRMEVFTCLIGAGGETLKKVSAEIIVESMFSEIPAEIPILLFGNGAAKCEGVISRPNIFIVNDFFPLASHMGPAAFEALQNGESEDIAYFEPYYLKDFIATVPRKKIVA